MINHYLLRNISKLQRHHQQHALRRRRSGTILLLVGLSLVALLGCCALAADYGRLVATKNLLQRTCDASALAAAAELPAIDSTTTGSAISYAQLTASQNGVTASEIEVAFPSANRVRVTATRQVSFLFAPVLGLRSGLVNATAVAGRSNLAGVPYNVPLAITVDDYNNNLDGKRLEEKLIDNNRQDFNNGTATALDLRNDNSGKSVAGFQEDLTNGWYQPVYFNTQINSALNASLTSQGGKLDQAMRDRFSRAAGAPWYDAGPGSGNSGSNSSYQFPNYPNDDPRIVTIIVAEPNPANNNNPQLLARKLAPVYIEDIFTRAGDTYIRMRILPKHDYNAEDPNIVIGDDSAPSTGLTVIRLFS
jgi:Flp pilus assembly protein TadG